MLDCEIMRLSVLPASWVGHVLCNVILETLTRSLSVSDADVLTLVENIEITHHYVVFTEIDR